MNEPEVLDALVAWWVADVQPTLRANACILAARTTSLVLDYYDITNKVLACEAFVFNDAALAELERGNNDPKDWPEGAWSIGVGRHSPGGGYAGHVVVLTESHALVDLTAGQFHRKGRIAIDGPRVWRDWWAHGDVMFMREGNVLLSMRASGSPVYRKAIDWRKGKALAGQAIRHINNQRKDHN